VRVDLTTNYDTVHVHHDGTISSQNCTRIDRGRYEFRNQSVITVLTETQGKNANHTKRNIHTNDSTARRKKSLSSKSRVRFLADPDGARPSGQTLTHSLSGLHATHLKIHCIDSMHLICLLRRRVFWFQQQQH